MKLTFFRHHKICLYIFLWYDLESGCTPGPLTWCESQVATDHQLSQDDLVPVGDTKRWQRRFYGLKPQHIGMFIHWPLVFFFWLSKRGSTIDVPNPVNLFIYNQNWLASACLINWSIWFAAIVFSNFMFTWNPHQHNCYFSHQTPVGLNCVLAHRGTMTHKGCCITNQDLD